MKLLKIAGCCIVLNGMVANGYGQTPIPQPVGKLDSVPQVLKNDLRNGKAKLTAPLRQLAAPSGSVLEKNALRAGKGQLDSLLSMTKSPFQPLTGEMKLLEGKPVAFTYMEAEADYSYFQDTA